jgi:hypothetical protein
MAAEDSLTPGQQLAEDTWPKMAKLTPEERKVFLDILTGEWCLSCGRQHPGYVCQCENDD